MNDANLEEVRQKVLLVTGMSGAGITTALKVLQDLGWEAVDNVPLSLVGNLVAPPKAGITPDHPRKPIAVGIDSRNRDFGVAAFVENLAELAAQEDVEVKTLFLECSDEELTRRYMETRARHPLAQDRPLADGIRRERRLIEPLRQRPDMLIDSTDMTVPEFKALMRERFGEQDHGELVVTVVSFGFKTGLPRHADMVFDVRFLRNPHYVDELREQTGLDEPVRAYVAADESFADFYRNLTNLIGPLLPRYRAEGKSYLTIAIGCTGGHHRSVFVADKLATWMEGKGQKVRRLHRDIEK